MSKKYSDEVIYLSKATGLSKYRCKAVLKACDGDINDAFIKLSEISSNKYEKAMDNITTLIRGEKGSIISVKEDGESLFRMPVPILIILLVLLDVPSWVVALILLLFMVFGVELDMLFADRQESELIRTVDTEEYKKQKKIEKQITVKNPMKSEDGYSEIIIEE